MRFKSLRYDGIELSPKRIASLTDGIFAIVMTLMAFDISVNKSIGPGGVVQGIGNMWIDIFVFVQTFLVLGIFWVGHHYQFHYIKRSDGVLIWINIFFLTSIAIFPFSRSLVAYLEPAGVAIYAGHVIATIILLYTLWWYATTNYRLVDSSISSHSINLMKKTLLAAIFSFLFVIAVSFYSVMLSVFLLAVLLVIYIFLTAVGH